MPPKQVKKAAGGSGVSGQGGGVDAPKMAAAKKERELQLKLREDDEEDDQDIDLDEPIVVDLSDFSAVKNCLDDGINAFVMSFNNGFEENHKWMDIRLGLYGAACFFALIASVYGFIVPHPDGSHVVGVCALLYFILVGVATVYIFYFDPGYLLDAARKNNQGPPDQLHVRTYLPRCGVFMEIEVEYVMGETKEVFSGHQAWNITQFFYADGQLAEDRLDKAVESLLHDTVTKKSQ